MMHHLVRTAGLVFGAALLLHSTAGAQQPAPRVLKIGHMFPAATDERGDFRDRMCRRFAAEVEKRSNGAFKFEIHAKGVLSPRVDQQVDALQAGMMQFCLLPLNTTFGHIPELGVTQLPGLIRTYEHALKWKTQPIGAELNAILATNGVVPLAWLWQPAGMLAVERAIMSPEQVVGLRVRAMGKSIDETMKLAGAQIVAVPAADVPKWFKERKLDVAMTSSTSLAEFKAQDVCHAVTTTRQRAVFFFPEPLLVSKSFFDALTPDQRKILVEVGELVEKLGIEWARVDDQRLAESYLASNAQVSDMDDDQFLAWQRIAKVSAWREFERNVPRGAELIQKALAVAP